MTVKVPKMAMGRKCRDYEKSINGQCLVAGFLQIKLCLSRIDTRPVHRP